MAIKIDSGLSGIHSRSENLVRISRDVDRGRSTPEQLESSFLDDARKLISLQSSAGFSSVSDGQLRWQDFIRPFSESVEGMKNEADLSRWYDTNTFYRKPIVEKKISFRKPLPKEGFFEGPLFEKRDIQRRISIPGPYTLASLVENRFYSSKIELIHAFGKVLVDVISGLEEAGFDQIQLNEPSLVYRYGESALTNKEHLRAFVESISGNLGTKARLTLHTYFGDCSGILEELLSIPGIFEVGVDFTMTTLANIRGTNFDRKSLGCGCVDGRNSLVENAEWISSFSAVAAKSLHPPGITILPSCDLKYLPREYADKKIQSIGNATRLLPKLLSAN